MEDWCGGRPDAEGKEDKMKDDGARVEKVKGRHAVVSGRRMWIEGVGMG